MRKSGAVVRPLTRSFFARSADIVAEELVGAVLVHGRCAGVVIETEAYLGEFDPAAHARHGLTDRTRVLYGLPGKAYVYQTRHHVCLNVSTNAVGTPGCVLIRAIRPVRGQALMRSRRGMVDESRLANGPANLCVAFDIRLEHYGVDLTSGPSPYLRAAAKRPDFVVFRDERIGISRARRWLLRFVADDPAVSRRPGQRARRARVP